MQNLLWVGLGGFLGAIGRYSVGLLVLRLVGNNKLPWGVLFANISGCFFVGFLVVFLRERGGLDSIYSAFLVTGLLGGFTTFSAFGYDTFELFRRGETLAAACYIVLSLLLGLFAVFLGIKIGEITYIA